jgi:hypothetical protein
MRSTALCLSGLWLGLLVSSWVLAAVNFRTVDRVLGPGMRPEVGERLGAVPPDDRRLVLRHLASEINRWMFRWWAVAQVALGVILLALVFRSPGNARWLVAGALVLLAAQAALGGALEALGRTLDFVPRPLPAGVGGRFGRLHGAYVLSDFAKAALVAMTAYDLARR